MFFKKKTTNKNDEKKRDKSHEDAMLAKKRILVHHEMIKAEAENRKKEKIAPTDCCISLQHVNKIYPNHVQAVYDFNLDIKEKEFIVLVGPSGCGKSTTLRMIAGLEDITAGDLYIGGNYANDLEPIDRDIAMVFQSYALYPHMSVYENMAFGLEMRHLPKDYIEKQVSKVSEILELKDYLDRKPAQLSGGQRQRVALGRAIVKNAKVFLMDEPLSNLDAKLRVQMRSEIVKLHKSLEATTIYVTHDQTEAMTMATRIVIMKDGKVQQIGTPKEIYSYPENEFVATFVGSPGMNLLPAVINQKTQAIVLENGFVLPLTKDHMDSVLKFYKDKLKELKDNKASLEAKMNGEEIEDEKERKLAQEVWASEIKETEEEISYYEALISSEEIAVDFGIRPEDIAEKSHAQLINDPSDSFKFDVTISELLGNEYHVHGNIGEKEVIAKLNANNEVLSEASIEVVIDRKKMHVFSKRSKRRIF